MTSSYQPKLLKGAKLVHMYIIVSRISIHFQALLPTIHLFREIFSRDIALQFDI